MGKYGETFLTKPRWYWDEAVYGRWITKSRWQFSKSVIEGFYSLSWLGIINGLPGSKWFRLACTVEDNTNEILGWKVIRWRW